MSYCFSEVGAGQPPQKKQPWTTLLEELNLCQLWGPRDRALHGEYLRSLTL